jgi:hypothetical protein
MDGGRVNSLFDFEIGQEIIMRPGNGIDHLQLPVSFRILQCEVAADFAGDAEGARTGIAHDGKLPVITPLPHFLNDFVGLRHWYDPGRRSRLAPGHCFQDWQILNIYYIEERIVRIA